MNTDKEFRKFQREVKAKEKKLTESVYDAIEKSELQCEHVVMILVGILSDLTCYYPLPAPDGPDLHRGVNYDVDDVTDASSLDESA